MQPATVVGHAGLACATTLCYFLTIRSVWDRKRVTSVMICRIQSAIVPDVFGRFFLYRFYLQLGVNSNMFYFLHYWNLNSHSTIIWDFNHHSRRPSKLHFLNSILSLTRKMGKPRIMFMKFSYFLTFLMIWEILQNTSYSLWKSVRSIFVIFEV